MLLAFARSRLGGRLIAWFFAHLGFLLPVRRVAESEHVLAFHHPQPSYPLHILLVPKKSIRSHAHLMPEDAGILLEILKTAQRITDQLDLAEMDCRLILNAGAYQEVPQLHFHLICESQKADNKKRTEKHH